tara:strand:- start:1054 stop:1887 length:834 start_codon:yes stop_codon:yes gene_type:complete
MARVLDPLDEQQELQLEEGEQLVDINDLSNTDVTSEETQETVTEVETQSEVPEEEVLDPKYANKSIAEVARMHQEAEKLAGRQGNELGDLRKTIDDFIKTKAVEATTETPKESVEVDFFDNPQKAVTDAISNSTEIKQMQELIAKQRQSEVLTKLSSKHPNYMDVVSDNAFIEWVKGSNVRLELLQRAESYDYDAADELLTFWKERSELVSKAQAVNEEDRSQQRKAATTGGRGSAEPISRKIYRRTDIVNLMIKDPDKYYANIDEIQKAYEENRVK